MGNLPFAVFLLAAGCVVAVLVPLAIRKVQGSVLDKTLLGMYVARAACVMLGAGGADAAAGAGAHVLSGWLMVAALVGVGIFLGSWATSNVKSLVDHKRQRSEGHPPASW